MLSSVISRLNDRRDAAADLGEDAGFTLIELMVVLLILAILQELWLRFKHSIQGEALQGTKILV